MYIVTYDIITTSIWSSVVYLYGEVCGVRRESLTHVSMGSWNGSASSLVPELTLSSPSSEVTEPAAVKLYMWCVCVSV